MEQADVIISRATPFEGITIYCDASFCPRTQTSTGAFIAYLSAGKQITAATFVLPEMAGSYEAELLTACKALRHVLEHRSIGRSVYRGKTRNIRLVLDCTDAMDTLLYATEGNLTEDVFQELHDVRALLKDSDITLTAHHIKAHTDRASRGYQYNRWCDEAARTLMWKVRSGLPTDGLMRQPRERSCAFINRVIKGLNLQQLDIIRSDVNVSTWTEHAAKTRRKAARRYRYGAWLAPVTQVANIRAKWPHWYRGWTGHLGVVLSKASYLMRGEPTMAEPAELSYPTLLLAA